ncbi:hypothetical protein [Marinicrinis lubricantis]|uniref:Uncharacterized protein n=1 Tax=Marinicrinis lubricantis TaxID=2086470 RepID=A0ABW1INM4_9BACL
MNIVLFLLEYIRVVILLLLGHGLLVGLEGWLLSHFSLHIPDNAFLLLFIGNFCILLILYRNLLQFKGWFVTKQTKKLSLRQNLILLCVAVISLSFAFMW